MDLCKAFPSAEAVHTAAGGGTPCYLYHSAGIIEQSAALTQWFGGKEVCRNYLNVQENANPGILRLMKDAGCGIIAENYEEMLLARECGYSGERLIYHPERQDSRAEAEAFDLDAVWLIDSVRLFPKAPVSYVLLRYYPKRPSRGPLSHCLYNKLHSGLTHRELLDAVRLFSARQTKYIGLELFLPVISPPLGFYAAKSQLLLDLAEEILCKTGVRIDICHLGNLPFQDDFSLSREAAQILTFWNERSWKPAIWMGLGNWILQDQAILLATVTDLRCHDRRYAVLDAGSLQRMLPAVRGEPAKIMSFSHSANMPQAAYRVYGPRSDPFGALARNCILPANLSPGDLCMISHVGCGCERQDIRSISSWLQLPDSTAQLLQHGDG